MNDSALDTRQRNMLAAMGIQLWQPDPSQPPSAAEPVAQIISEEKLEENRPVALSESAPPAIKKIATTAPTALAPPPDAVIAAPVVSLTPREPGIERMTWQALQSAVASCGACALCQSRKQTVFGVGQKPADEGQAPQVDWLIVGEAPGEHEDAQGEPFVGQAGKLLDQMLAAMKVGVNAQGQPTALSRSQGSYIVNVLKCRPPANRNPSPEEVAMCEPYLARQIELLRPKIIVAMGKFAISSLTGSNDPVGKLRGRVHPLRHASYQAPVIVTYHPAYLLRNLPEKAKAWADLLLAMQTYSELSAKSEAAPSS
jgi:uracil-DNA glycosylase